MSKIEARLAKTLLNKATVITRAVFWKIPHSSEREDIRLKLGRYKKSADFSSDMNEGLDSLEPKSELTLDHEEFKSLIDFLQQSYEPFRQGIKAFLPLDRPFDAENAKQIRALFSIPEKRSLVKFILDNNVIPDDLVISLRYAQRVKAVQYFENMLTENLLESEWQKWFQKNSWVLGSQFVRILDQRQIDTSNISDFLMQAYDGFLDIVEIKRPGELKFWASTLDHGNHVPSTDLIKATSQSFRYIYELEREANSIKFIESVGHVKTIKPRCILVFGRSNDWTPDQQEAYRILNSGFHNLSILTYDHVLIRAKRILDLDI
jgi:hypothetical protein